MALTRKALKAMGIEEEKIEQIIEEHVNVTDGLKAERDRYKNDSEKLVEVQRKLDNYEKNGDEETVSKSDYDALKKEYDDYRDDVASKEIKSAKERAFRELLKDAGISDKRIDSIVKVSNVDEIELDENGKVKDEETRKEQIKTEWSDFIPTTETIGANTPNPPAKSGNQTMTKADIVAISDPAERRAAIAQNMSLFGEK